MRDGPHSVRPRKVRARTIANKRLLRKEQIDADAAARVVAEYEDQRPRVLADCFADDRPCPWVSCKHHLYLDVSPETGSIKLNFPDLEPWELAETCALDVADRGGVTLEETGELLNLTRERVRQVEVHGLMKIRMAPLEELDPGDIYPEGGAAPEIDD